MTQSNTSPNSFMRQNERKTSRTRSPRRRSPSGRMSRWLFKDYLKGTCNNSFCEKWHPPECLYYKTKSGCRFGEKCSFAHRQVDEPPSKRCQKNGDKSAVAMLKKGDWHGRGPVTDQNHDRSGNLVTPIQCRTRKNESLHGHATFLHCAHQTLRGFAVTDNIHRPQVVSPSTSITVAYPQRVNLSDNLPGGPKISCPGQSVARFPTRTVRQDGGRCPRSVIDGLRSPVTGH